MKHLSLGLTALILGALPFAAAALDYGPNQALLAASQSLPTTDGDAPTLPGAPPHATMHTDDVAIQVPATPGADHATEVAATPASNRTGTTSNAPTQRIPPANAPVPRQPSWQSLLPGSIQ